MSTQKSNQDPNLKLPGESDPDFAKIVSEYLAKFHCRIRLDIKNLDRKELYEWCSKNLGEKYKDWFVYEGGKYDKWWTIHIMSPKKSTFFRIKYNDIILDSVDIEH